MTGFQSSSNGGFHRTAEFQYFKTVRKVDAGMFHVKQRQTPAL